MILRRFLALLLSGLLLVGPAYAQPVIGGGLFQPAASSTYTGPGDVVSSAFAWYGLRAYNRAQAVANVKAVNIKCLSGSNTAGTFDVNVLSSGAFDIATASSDCGNDGVVTASIATTVLSVTVLSSGQLTVGDQITGTGVTNPTYIISAGTCTSGAVSPPCTFNISQSMTVASETITGAAGISIATWYDQSGAGHGDVTQATASKRPLILTNCLNTTLPCVAYLIANASALAKASGFTLAQPFSDALVIERTGSFTTSQRFLAFSTAHIDSFTNSANTTQLSSGSNFTATANDSTLHSLIYVVNNASSSIVVDGTATTGTAGATGQGTAIGVGADTNGATPMTGYIAEVGEWGAAFSSGQYASMCANQRAYWGSAGSC